MGIEAWAPNRIRSIAIITGRLRRNSTQGPSGSATSAPAASEPASTSYSVGLAVGGLASSQPSSARKGMTASRN
jgi:hypothetical protein